MTGILQERGNVDTLKEDHVKTQGEDSHVHAKEASEERDLQTMISEFQLPELQGN